VGSISNSKRLLVPVDGRGIDIGYMRRFVVPRLGGQLARYRRTKLVSGSWVDKTEMEMETN